MATKKFPEFFLEFQKVFLVAEPLQPPPSPLLVAGPLKKTVAHQWDVLLIFRRVDALKALNGPNSSA